MSVAPESGTAPEISESIELSSMAGIKEWIASIWAKDFWKSDGFWWSIGSISLVTLIISFVVLPIVIIRMPADYFMPGAEGRMRMASLHPVLRIIGLVAKNLLGIILFAAGVVMAFTPGQGFLTMFMGLVLMNFPGKMRLELWVIRREPVRRSINWVRDRAGRRPLQLPEE